MNSPTDNSNPNAPHDLVVVADAHLVSLIRADARVCRPLLRLPLRRDRKTLLPGVLSRLVRENRPRRVFLTVLPGAPLPEVVDVVVTALEDMCDESGLPLVWLPNLTEVVTSLRELGTDLASAPPRVERSEPRQ